MSLGCGGCLCFVNIKSQSKRKGSIVVDLEDAQGEVGDLGRELINILPDIVNAESCEDAVDFIVNITNVIDVMTNVLKDMKELKKAVS